MAIFRIIHGIAKYHDNSALFDVIRYCTRADKTKGLVGSLGVSADPEWAIFQMQVIQSCFGKTEGIHLRHFILSFEKDDEINPSAAFAVGQQIVQYYGWYYQIIFAVHTDTAHPHIHFVMNAVSYIDGRKYPGDKKDYYAFVKHIKDVLSLYHLCVQTAS